MSEHIRVRGTALVDAVRSVLEGESVPRSVAQVEADLMVQADMLEVPSHGVAMLPGMVDALRAGRVKPDPAVGLVRERGATCVMDGDLGPGRYTSATAMDFAVTRARLHGAGVCVAGNMTHWGRAHSYADLAARQGMIGLCATNAMTNMLAFGSSRPLLGNNPLAIGVPRGEGRDPVVLDMAMSQAALGKVATYSREGREVPPDWGLDSSGSATRDPAALLASGLMLPMGGHKGSGLSLMIEFLTAALAGGMLSYEIAAVNVGMETGSSKLFLALDPEAFTERSAFERRVEDLLTFLRSRSDEGSELLFPGERGWRARERSLTEGVPVHRQLAESLESLGVHLVEH